MIRPDLLLLANWCSSRLDSHRKNFLVDVWHRYVYPFCFIFSLALISSLFLRCVLGAPIVDSLEMMGSTILTSSGITRDATSESMTSITLANSIACSAQPETVESRTNVVSSHRIKGMT